MRIVLLAHPAFMASQSMPRFAAMLRDAYAARGHEVQLWAPPARLRRWIDRGPLARWAGYADQYLLFPLWLRAAVARQPADTLFVLTDQAQGPWAPRIRHRPHVVHVHDLLALRSALGEIPQNPTRFTGRLYQRFIRRGYQHARHFICISQRTRDDLTRLSRLQAETCEVVHNGLNAPFAPLDTDAARQLLREAGLPDAPRGMVLHVSGGQWYKNVVGVLQLYGAYARQRHNPLPLWLIGVRPGPAEQAEIDDLPPQAVVHIAHGLSHTALQACYSLARAFLFPSHAEGFGWPIVEAQACGCPVITTDDAPMNEIGGPVTRYLPLLNPGDDPRAWAALGATVLSDVAHATDAEAAQRRSQALAWAGRFQADTAIEAYLRVYRQVLTSQGATVPHLVRHER